MRIGIVGLFFGLYEQDIARQLLYTLWSAILILISVQLIISWILVQVLDEISQREELTKQDLTG